MPPPPREDAELTERLISHGADVHYHYYPYAFRPLDIAFYKKNAAAALLLIDNGADVSRLNTDGWEVAVGNHRLLRIVLAAGADINASVHGRTPEAFARHAAATIYYSARAAIYEESASILEGVRLAGSYRQYVLQDYKRLLRLRSLLARGRALIGPRNPDVVARLFGGRFDAWATFPHRRLAGVPDPAFWLVMEYWRLGDWRRPA